MTDGMFEKGMDGRQPGRPGHFHGRTLSFVRQLLNVPARYPSAAMAASRQVLRDDPVAPPFRTVAWYRTERPFGNVALSLGEGWVLTYESKPVVRRYDAPVLGEYLGWSETIK